MSKSGFKPTLTNEDMQAVTDAWNIGLTGGRIIDAECERIEDVKRLEHDQKT